MKQSREEPVGPFRNEQAALGFVCGRLAYALQPELIILFGSRARGDARADSDFDILVVLPDGRPADAYTHEAVAEPLVASGLAYDVVPCSASDLLISAANHSSLGHRALTEGRIIYRSQKSDLPDKLQALLAR